MKVWYRWLVCGGGGFFGSHFVATGNSSCVRLLGNRVDLNALTGGLDRVNVRQDLCGPRNYSMEPFAIVQESL